ncbi:MAG: LuxR C-terminal-related transcriptional regulator [Renibacterium salmoninarum]|nr:LuxR C-terminal-related transcriptional regulator [Renibacterium salmoninarum]
MKTVDRVAELGRLIEVNAADTESALVVIGDAGLGKTYLLERFSQEAEGVILVRANPAERAWEFSGLSAFLAALRDPQAQALSSDLSWAGTEGPFRAGQELLSRLTAMELPPTTVAIDDVDIMDDSSQAVLGFLARRLGGTGLKLILSLAELEPCGPFSLLPELALAELDPTKSILLGHRLAKPGTDPAAIQIIAVIASGIPVYLREGLEALTEAERQGRDPLTYPVQFGPRAAFAAQTLLAAQDDCGKEVVRLVSTAPVHLEVALREILAEHQSALDELLARRILVRAGDFIRMRQAVLRCALYVSVAAVERQRLHEQLEKAHRKHKSSLEQWHSSFLHDGETSPRMLLSTALELVERGDSGLATAYADRAILLLSFETEEISDLLCDLSTAMVDMGELAYASRYLRKAAELSNDPTIRIRSMHQLIRIRYMSTHDLNSRDVAGVLKQYGTEFPDLCLELASIVTIFHAERWEMKLAERMLKLAEPLVPMAGEVANGVHRFALMTVSVLNGDPTPATEQLKAVTALGLREIPIPVLMMLGRSLTFAERYEESRMVFDSLLSRTPPPKPIWLETIRFFRTENEMRVGNFHRAGEAVESLHSSPDVRQFHVTYLHILRSWYFLVQDDEAAAQTHIDAVLTVASGGGNWINAARISALRGRHALAHGRFEEAFHHFLRVHESGGGKLNPAFLRYEGDLIEVLVALGRSAEAKRFMMDLELRNRQTPSLWATLVAARCRALVADGELSLQLFRQGIKLARELGTGYEQARSLLDFSERLRELGYLAQSEQQKNKAKVLFEELGVPSWSERPPIDRRGRSGTVPRLRSALGKDGARSILGAPLPEPAANLPVAGPDAPARGAELMRKLSPGEHQVVERVLSGLRNKEIAALLGVSLRTVETRLTNVYKKTGASSRAHLVALINEESGAPRDAPDHGNVVNLRSLEGLTGG